MADAAARNGTSGALAGVRVVEIPAGRAAAYCGQLFAQCGADVVRLEAPEGDLVRQSGPFKDDQPDLDGGGLHSVLNAGKRSVIADLHTDDGVRLAAELIGACDVLLTSCQLASDVPWLSAEQIAARFPDVTYVSISPFGRTGPYATNQADSHVIEALAGFSYVTGDPDREPLSMGVELADYFAGVSGFSSALVALLDRCAGHVRRFVDVSALEALAHADDHTLVVYAGAGAVRRRYYSRVLIAYPMDLLPCKDGSIAFVPGHGDFASGVSQLIERPELASHPVFTSPRERVLRWREFDAYVRPWLDAHTPAEVLERARGLRLAFGPVMTARDLLEDEHLRARGFFRASERATAIGPPIRLSDTPTHTAAAPALGEHQAQPWLTPRSTAAGGQTRGNGFFEGLRVIDLSHVWAGPVVTRMLADLGADVVKVERADRPENSRAGFPAGNDTTGDYWHRSPYFVARQAGKRSIVLDLASEDGRAVLHRLLEAADVLVENFTPRVMQKFGLHYEALRDRYPRLVMASVCGFGQDGPRANDPALGQTIEPGSGISTVTGYEGEPPIKAGNTLIDAMAGMHGVAGLLAALMARERTGRGQHVDISMQEVAIQLAVPQIMDYMLNGRLSSPTGNRRPGSVRGTYRCAGDDDWVALTAATDDQWEAVCAVAGRLEWARDPRFTDAAGRSRHHDAIDELIAGWTSQLGKFEVMQRLQEAGVAAGAVLKADEIFLNEQLAARRFFAPIEIHGYGAIPLQRYWPALFDGTALQARGPAPLIGEHTEEILADLGCSKAEIQRLREMAVIEPDLAELDAPAARAAREMALDAFLEQGSLLRIDADYRQTLDRALAMQSG